MTHITNATHSEYTQEHTLSTCYLLYNGCTSPVVDGRQGLQYHRWSQHFAQLGSAPLAVAAPEHQCKMRSQNLNSRVFTEKNFYNEFALAVSEQYLAHHANNNDGENY